MPNDGSRQDPIVPTDRVTRLWRLSVLGGFRLIGLDGQEATLTGRIDPALLTYLVLTPNVRHTRAHLAAIFWATRADGLHSLSVSLNKIRAALGDRDGAILPHKADPVTIDLGCLDVDVAAFERMADRADLASLQQADALWTGQLLAGFDLASDGFEEWLAAERRRLEDRLVEVRERLLRGSIEAGRTEAAVATARQLLEIDPLHEEAHRALVRIELQAGRRSAALRAAQRCEEALRTEGIEPEPETLSLLDELRRGGPAAPGPPAERPPQAIPGSPAVRHEGAPAARGAARLAWRRMTRGAAVLLIAGLLSTGAVAFTGYYAVTFWRIPLLAPWPFDLFTEFIVRQVTPEVPTIAILPFESQGDEGVAQYADALSDAVGRALSIASASRIRVAPRTSVLASVQQSARILDLATDLDVQYFLEGNVQRFGDYASVGVSLIDSRDGERRIWTKSYERRQSDISVLLNEIVIDIVTELKVTLTEGEPERIERVHGTRDLTAFLELSQAENQLRLLTRRSNREARLHYVNALERDPSIVGAITGIAWTHFVDAHFAWTDDPATSLAIAADYARRAQEIDPDRARNNSLLGFLSLLAGDFEQALALGERAVKLEPFDADATALLAYTLTFVDRPERAIAMIEQAMRLRPHPPPWYGWLQGRAYRLAGDHGRAIEILGAVPASESALAPLCELAAAYAETGARALALSVGRRILDREPGFSVSAWVRVHPYADPEIAELEKQLLLMAGLPP